MRPSARFLDALCYAVTLHDDQRRKLAGEPYTAHLLAVAAIVMEYGGNEDEAIAALLHDAVEDQGGAPTLAEIRRRFGETVADIVEGCTDTAVTPKPPWRPRKEAYLARVKNASASVRLVSAADKLHNARSILRELRRQGASIWGHFNGGRDGTLWYYRAVVETLKLRSTGPLVEELDRTVAEIQQLVREIESHHADAENTEADAKMQTAEDTEDAETNAGTD